MNEVDTSVTDTDLEITVMPVHRYEARPACEKCGLRVTLVDEIRQVGASAATWVYCKGSMDSTVEVNRLLVGKTEVKTSCFGVFVEHLHLSCHRCGWHWLMATKGGK
jgi:hypothetical protein